MARFWKERYSREKAERLGIHDFEGSVVVGPTDAKWIYYVEVSRFTFAFFSLPMIKEYLDFYLRKILPSSRFYGASPYSVGAAASVGDGQSKFERLPQRLRKEPRRQQVVKALERALLQFGSAE
jgi:hypothetical protein